MSADGLAGELLTSDRTSGDGSDLPVAAILGICDRALGEAGRRRHLFGWLRDPDAANEGWLPVDGYYPRNRIVVVCRAQPGRHDRLYSELIPAHGLLLLVVSPSDLEGDPEIVRRRIERMIEALRATTRPRDALRATARPREVVRAAPTEATPAQATSADGRAESDGGAFDGELWPAGERSRLGPARAAAAARAARFGAAHRPAGQRRRAPDRNSGFSIAIAVACVIALFTVATVVLVLIAQSG